MQNQVQAFSAPDSLEVQDFQFRLQRCVQVCDPSLRPEPSMLNLAAAASRFGLVFVGAPDNALHVFRARDLVSGEGKRCSRRTVPLPSRVVHLAVNCDNELLSVVLNKNDALTIVIYDTRSFALQSPKINREIQLNSAPGIQLCTLEWNPCQADSLAVCTSDGNLSIFQCKPNSIDLQSKRTGARCLSWSPKGKQIVTGNSDGTVSQFKPDLSIVKSIPAPHLYESATIEVLSIQWISTYQFGVVYNEPQSSENRACVTILNTPKGGTPSCINYEDICYSMDSSRCVQFYLWHISQWGVLLASSSNSIEIGALGTSDQANWQQYIQLDEARAELPLTENKQENYPAGFCFDNAATIQLPWGESATLPHMPMIHMLSHTGLLVTFFAINIQPNATPFCINPEEIVIPNNLLTEDFPITQPVKTTQQDISFVISQNTVTSTPTVPKMDRNVFGSIANAVPEEKPPSYESSSKALNFQPPNPISQLASMSPPAPSKPFDSAFSNMPKVQNQPTLNSNIPDIQQNQLKAPVVTEAPPNIIKTSESKSEIQAVPIEIIKAMLIKEVNHFQQELFELLKKCKNIDTDIGTPDEMNKIATILSTSNNPLKKNCSNQEIIRQVAMLKHSLISTCAFLAEAKMQPVNVELEHLSQLDPVSAEQMSSIKLAAYYVESQLEQINSALNEQWETFQEQCKRKAMALRGVSDKDDMKMPTLDKIYQPLLKQADILIKQQAIVASLEKSISALKLPKKPVLEKYSNSNENLQGLSKGLGNMSINKNDSRSNVTNLNKKNDLLRGLLKNHKTVTIKPTKNEAPSMLDMFQEWEIDSKQEEEKEKENNIKKNISKAAPVIQTNDIVKTQIKTVVPPASSSLPAEPPKQIDYNSLSSLNNFVSKMVPQKVEPAPIASFASFNKEKSPISIAPNVTISKIEKLPISTAPTKPANSPATSALFSVPPNVTIFTPPTVPQGSAFNFVPNSKQAAVPAFPAFSKAAEPAAKPLTIATTVATSVATTIVTTAAQPIAKEAIKPAETKPAAVFGNGDLSKPFPSVSQKGTFDFSFKSPATTATSIFGFNSASTATSTFSFVPKSTVATTEASLPAATNIFGASTDKAEIKSPPVASNIFGSNSNKTEAKDSPVTSSIFGSNISTTETKSPPVASNVFVSNENKTETKDPPMPSNIFNSSTDKTEIKSPPVISNNIFSANVNKTEASKAQGFNFSISSLSVSSAPPNSPNDSVSTASTPPANIFSLAAAVSSSSTAITKTEPSISIFSQPFISKSEPIAIVPPPVSTTAATFQEVKPAPAVIPAKETSELTIKPAEKPLSDFGFGSLSTGSIFASKADSLLTANNTTAVKSIFGGTAAVSSAETSKISTDSPFSLTKSPTNIFGQPTAPSTCASALFGAANASIDTSVTTLFGSTTISATSAPSLFKSPTVSTGSSIFGGFGGQATFGSTPAGGSIFGGSGGTAFGQPQGSSVFGGAPAFGALGSTSPQSNIFGQSTQPTNVFGAATSPPAQNVFGGSPLAKSTFGAPAASPATPQQSSIFGSPTSTPSASVFGGSPTFGAKPMFGQPASFGSPSGGFGMFSGGDQNSVAQSGFGSPSAFGKPAEPFGRSPEFGAAPAFGSSPSFASPATFGSGSSPFSSPMGMQSGGFGGGSQQSSTFESLATQSSISFGNLAQQSQQPQPNAPVFQGSSSFSTWR